MVTFSHYCIVVQQESLSRQSGCDIHLRWSIHYHNVPKTSKWQLPMTFTPFGRTILAAMKKRIGILDLESRLFSCWRVWRLPFWLQNRIENIFRRHSQFQESWVSPGNFCDNFQHAGCDRIVARPSLFSPKSSTKILRIASLSTPKSPAITHCQFFYPEVNHITFSLM